MNLEECVLNIAHLDGIPQVSVDLLNDIELFERHHVAADIPGHLYLLMARYLTLKEVVQAVNDTTQEQHDFLNSCAEENIWPAIKFFDVLSQKLPSMSVLIDQYMGFDKERIDLFELAYSTAPDPIAYVAGLPHETVVKLNKVEPRISIHVLKTIPIHLADTYLYASDTLGHLSPFIINALLGEDEIRTLEIIDSIENKDDISERIRDNTRISGIKFRCFETLDYPNYELLESEWQSVTQQPLIPPAFCEDWLKDFADIYAGLPKEKRKDVLSDMNFINLTNNNNAMPELFRFGSMYLKDNPNIFTDASVLVNEGVSQCSALRIGRHLSGLDIYSEVPAEHQEAWIELLTGVELVGVESSEDFVKLQPTDVPIVAQAYQFALDANKNREFMLGLSGSLKIGNTRKWAEAITKHHLKNAAGGDGYRRMNDSKVIAA
jgi:hypothetical protein